MRILKFRFSVCNCGQGYSRELVRPSVVFYTSKIPTDLFVITRRVIRELEAQLEYEREKREKLEAQMDKLRAQIHTLTLQLEDERCRHLTSVSAFTWQQKSLIVMFSPTVRRMMKWLVSLFDSTVVSVTRVLGPVA